MEGLFQSGSIDQKRSSANWPLAKILQRYINHVTWRLGLIEMYIVTLGAGVPILVASRPIPHAYVHKLLEYPHPHGGTRWDETSSRYCISYTRHVWKV